MNIFRDILTDLEIDILVQHLDLVWVFFEDAA